MPVDEQAYLAPCYRAYAAGPTFRTPLVVWSGVVMVLTGMAAAGGFAAASSWSGKPSGKPLVTGKAEPPDGPVSVPTSMGMPCGASTATSFNDPGTASGRSMSYHTIASPYWPLGTKVRITYRGRGVVGVVEDFGPAQWAVAQHAIPAIIDVSTDMMRDLTGVADDAVPVRFQVLEWGRGTLYRISGVGRDRAYSCQ